MQIYKIGGNCANNLASCAKYTRGWSGYGLSSPQKEILVVKATKEIPVSYSNTVKVLIYINHNNWGKGLAVSSTSIICDIAHFLSMDSDRK